MRWYENSNCFATDDTETRGNYTDTAWCAAVHYKHHLSLSEDV